ncbi:C4b-binding protein alpha chain-like, partial [Nannospalax galili]|uniref:C4b-binding protein alpha chain-like n=1 Tax=Nannospalax galili TaxID=1026970 RepID=UPI00111C5F01
ISLCPFVFLHASLGITCPWPDIPNGKIVSGFRRTYNYKDSVLFACQKGFILRGSSLIHCEAGNNWSPSLPICERNSCTNIPDIPHALWVEIPESGKEGMGVYQAGTVLRYRCHRGYEPATHAPTTVTCQRNFTWSPFKGCKKICCPIPNLENIRILQPRKHHPENGCIYFYGDTVSYSCHDKQILSATCRSDGTWDPQISSCHQSCSFPPNIAHGHYTQHSTLFKYYASYQCDEGYKLVGQAELSCIYSQWSEAAPQCKALCLKPEVENGKLSVDKDQYIEHENVTIHCDAGFTMLGSQNITCSANRTWYPEVPKCEWEGSEGCKQVLKGRELMHCLSSPEDVKMALEVYKLSLEIELLELQRDKLRKSLLKPPL